MCTGWHVQGVKDKTTKKMINGLTTELFDALDSDSSGNITFSEFMDKVENDDDVWKCLSMLSPFTRALAHADTEATHFGTITI